MRKKIGLALLVLSLIAAGFTAYKKRSQLALWVDLCSEAPDWAKKQIASDFSPFEKGISQEALDETFDKITSQKIPAYRYRIQGGKVYRKPGGDHVGRAGTYDKMLKRIIKSTSLPNLDFIICVMDGVPEVYVPQRFWITEKQAPLLCWAKKKDAPNLILIPDILTTKEYSWHLDVNTVNEKYLSIPWDKREEKAFWRGTASDKIYTLENYREKPRYKISMLSKQRPDFVDAGYCKAPEEIAKVLADLNLIVGHSSLGDHLSFKYLPVLDGWMCTIPGYQWRLLSGSLTMKQESDEVQYFYSALKPFVHYIPIQHDMSDLVEKIEWARAHDPECRLIAENARAFALAHLMPNQVYSYFYHVLCEYASKQTFNDFVLDESWVQQ